MKPWLEMTVEEAARARADLVSLVGEARAAVYVSRLALDDAGETGLAITQPRLYDPNHTDVAPSGRPWITGNDMQPTERELLETKEVVYSLAEAVELLEDRRRNPEAEMERRRRRAADAAAVARTNQESGSALHNERQAVNQEFKSTRLTLGAELWERELPGWGKLAFRLEAACRKVGQQALADEIRTVALDSLKVTSNANPRVEVTSAEHMYLDGPPMPMERWLP